MLARTSGLEHSISPVDLPDPTMPLPHPLRWTSRAIATATVTLALLNAHAIRGWAYELAPSDASMRVTAAAEVWYDALDRVGLNAPVTTMRGWWRVLKARRFDGQASTGTSPSRSASA